MVVHNFDVGGLTVLPHEADPIPLVDPNAVLAGAAVLESLQAQARGLEVMERAG
jgi:hypothetical protein